MWALVPAICENLNRLLTESPLSGALPNQLAKIVLANDIRYSSATG